MATQAEQILSLLRKRGLDGATNFELMQISYQYPARIHTLRHRDGHTIETKHVKDKLWRITLIKDADMPDLPPPRPASEPTHIQESLIDPADIPPPKKQQNYQH